MTDTELAASLASGEFSAIPADATCRITDAWIEVHQGDLPRTLDEITAGPISARAAVFSALPARTRYEIVKEHLREVDVTGMSEEQQAKLDEVRGALRPRLFVESADKQKIGEEFARDHGTSQEMRELFGDQRAKEIFASLGEPLPERLSGQSSVATQGVGCTCSQYDTWCGGSTCQPGTCRQASWGCGWFLRHRCDGGCDSGEAYPEEA